MKPWPDDRRKAGEHVDPAAVAPAVLALRAEGVLTRGIVGGSLQISPPLTVTSDDLAELAGALRRVLG